MPSGDTMNNYFTLEDDEYKRDLDPVHHYIEQAAFYLSKTKNKPIEECKELVKNALRDRVKFPNIRNPRVIHYQKQENGDKRIETSSLTKYIQNIIDNKELIAPSFTSYINSSNIKSMISEFATSNVVLRSKVKKEMFKAKAQGNKEKAQSLDLAQKNYKQYNNALSGALVSNGSVVKNPSGHSSLTSTTRTVTSLGNASNERLIAGNRHYRSPDICMYNIVSIISKIDLDKIRTTIERYNLNYPSIEDCIKCIQRSSDYYWHDNNWYNKFREFFSKLSKEELAAFVYTGDLYQLRLINPDFVRIMIDELTMMVSKDGDIETIKKDFNNYDEYVVMLSRLINYDNLKGMKSTNLLDAEEDIIRKIVGTCEHIVEVLERYKYIFSTFFITDHVPPSVAYISDMIRRSVVLSDTDSTCASYGEWVEWRYGKTGISSKGISFSAGVMTIGTQAISHVLALLSANIGVDKSNLHRLAMKNEFLWTIFCPANISKTYFASTMVQEGVIFPEYDLEFKGVQYKSANNPKIVNDLIKEMMRYVIDSVTETGKYSLNYLLQKVYNLEKTIINYIDNKDPRALDYFSQLNIKDAGAYALEAHRSNYFHYLLWEEVFEPKYGKVAPPPFRSIKIPLNIANKTDIINWRKSIEDNELAERLGAFLLKYNKTDIKLICLPIDYVQSNGIPIEIRQIISIERLLNNVAKGAYLLLESLGFIRLPDQPYISSIRR